MKIRVPRFTRRASLTQRTRRLTTRKPRAIESRLPMEIRRPMVAALGAGLFAYMPTMPEYRSMAAVLWVGAVFAATLSLWFRRPRATAAGLLGGAGCALVSIPLRLGDAPVLALPALVAAFGGVLVGCTANSSLKDLMVGMFKAARSLRWYGVGLLGLAVYVGLSVDAERLLRYLPVVTNGRGVLLAVVAASVMGGAISAAAGWCIGRAMRRVAGAGAHDDGDAWSYWEALYRQ